MRMRLETCETTLQPQIAQITSGIQFVISLKSEDVHMKSLTPGLLIHSGRQCLQQMVPVMGQRQV